MSDDHFRARLWSHARYYLGGASGVSRSGVNEVLCFSIDAHVNLHLQFFRCSAHHHASPAVGQATRIEQQCMQLLCSAYIGVRLCKSLALKPNPQRHHTKMRVVASHLKRLVLNPPATTQVLLPQCLRPTGPVIATAAAGATCKSQQWNADGGRSNAGGALHGQQVGG